MKFNMIYRASLPVLTGTLVVASVFATAAILLLLVRSELKENQAQQAISHQERSLKVAALQFAAHYPDVTLVWENETNLQKIIVNKLPDFPEHSLIDNITRATEDPATIFAFIPDENDFVRVSTTVKKKDGSRAIGTKLGHSSAAFEPLMHGQTYHGEAAILDIPYYTVYMPILDRFGKVIGVLFSGVKKSHIADLTDRLLLKILCFSAFLTGLFAVLGFLAARKLTSPFSSFASLVGSIDEGSCSLTIPYTDRTNELGLIARAFKKYRDSTLAQASELAELDARHAAEEAEKRKHLETQIIKFQTIITRAVAILGEQVSMLQVSAQALSEAAEIATIEAANAASVSESAADNANSVAAATEELSCTIREVADQVHRTNSVIEGATQETIHTNEDVAGLARAAEEIGSIISLIRGIADQTNLLALNATIEAARAGDVGRGFAVVAAEVKELSAQTARATDGIADQIHAIQNSTSTAIAAIQSIACKVKEIQSFSGSIAAAVEEQKAAADEIASNIANAAEGSERAAASSGEVSQAASQTRQQMLSVSAVSRQLSQVSTQISVAIRDFVTEIGAQSACLEPAVSEPESSHSVFAAAILAPPPH
jgi:methyl-accepting chemotaxis protein